MMLVLAAVLLGALVYRMRGGFGPGLPRPIDQLIFAAPYAYMVWLFATEPVPFPYFREVFAVCMWLATTAVVCKGHGKHMDLGTWNPAADDEWYEPVIKWTRKYLSVYWYDALGLVVSGMTYTVYPMVGLLAFKHPGIGLLVLFSGALKAPAYMLALYLFKTDFPKFGARSHTPLGEALTGAFLWGSLALIYTYV